MSLPTSVIVVSGLPRSGTSLMMQMLHAGGMELLCDETRAADVDNPRGYYELESVKELPVSAECLADAEGKAVKIIYKLLSYLPAGREYRVLFMRRDVSEVVISQNRMLARRGRGDLITAEAETAALLSRELAAVEAWLAVTDNVECMDVSYHDLLVTPLETCAGVATFLEMNLDTEAMASSVDPTLYRCRRANDKMQQPAAWSVPSSHLAVRRSRGADV